MENDRRPCVPGLTAEMFTKFFGGQNFCGIPSGVTEKRMEIPSVVSSMIMGFSKEAATRLMQPTPRRRSSVQLLQSELPL